MLQCCYMGERGPTATRSLYMDTRNENVSVWSASLWQICFGSLWHSLLLYRLDCSPLRVARHFNDDAWELTIDVVPETSIPREKHLPHAIFREYQLQAGSPLDPNAET